MISSGIIYPIMLIPLILVAATLAWFIIKMIRMADE